MPTYHHGPSRRIVIFILTGSLLLSLIFVSSFRKLQQGTRDPNYADSLDSSLSLSSSTYSNPSSPIHPDTLTGRPIAPKLGNETAKAELGRAAWKLFHTTFARFPDNPTQDEQVALHSWVLLFQRLYPCGECAGHFGDILKRFPPQVTSRSTAAAWGCHVHNEVNKSLDKEIWDCSKIGDFYDCGCADGEGDDEEAEVRGTTTGGDEMKAHEVAEDERSLVKLKNEGLMRGG